MVWPHKKGGRSKSGEERNKVETRFTRARGRPKSQWEEHKKAKYPQLEGEDPGSEDTEENHKRGGKDERGIGIGTKENVK